MMDETYRHLYLYSKGWYKKNDMFKDLRKIVAKRCGLYNEHVSIKDVVLVLSHAVHPHIKFDVFINKLMDERYFYPELEMENILIKNMLYVLANTNKKEIGFDLGEPDPNILPLS